MSQNMQKALKRELETGLLFLGRVCWLIVAVSPTSPSYFVKGKFLWVIKKCILLTEAIIWHDNFGAVPC